MGSKPKQLNGKTGCCVESSEPEEIIHYNLSGMRMLTPSELEELQAARLECQRVATAYFEKVFGKYNDEDLK